MILQTALGVAQLQESPSSPRAKWLKRQFYITHTHTHLVEMLQVEVALQSTAGSLPVPPAQSLSPFELDLQR